MTTDKTKLRRLLSAGLGNQVISSLTNFAFGVYLLKTMLPADYGLYNIAFAVMVFIGGFSQGFFLVQMTVLSPAKHADERTAFAERTLLLLATTCLVFLVLATVGILALQVYGIPLGTTGLPWLIALASVAYMLKEFHIRHAFNEARGRDAVFIHAALALVLLTGVLLAKATGCNMQVDLAMLLYLLAHLVAATLGQWRSGIIFSRQSAAQLRATLRELHIGGKWAAATNVVYAIRNQAHTVVVAASIGAVGVAQLSASRLLVTPAILLLPALSQVALPRLAELREKEGYPGLWRAERRIATALLGVAILYSAILLSAFQFLAPWVFGSTYSDLFNLTAAWCIYAIALSAHSAVDWTAQALQKFKAITTLSALAALVAIAGVSMLTKWLDVVGAPLGIAAAEISLTLSLLLLTLKKNKRADE